MCWFCSHLSLYAKCWHILIPILIINPSGVVYSFFLVGLIVTSQTAVESIFHSISKGAKWIGMLLLLHAVVPALPAWAITALCSLDLALCYPYILHENALCTTSFVLMHGTPPLSAVHEMCNACAQQENSFQQRWTFPVVLVDHDILSSSYSSVATTNVPQPKLVKWNSVSACIHS